MPTFLVALSTWLHAVAVFSERAFLGQISEEKPQALKRFHWSLNMLLGLVILLLTSIAQAG